MSPPPRTAVVLAAGLGSRLFGLTSGLPKCLLDIAGKPLLFRLLEQMQAVGIERAVIVTGHLRDRLERALEGHPFEVALSFAENPDYRTTNTAASLLAARAAIAGDAHGGILLCDGDVILAPDLLPALAAEPEPSALLFDPNVALDAEAMKAELTAAGCVKRLSKELPLDQSHGESIGVQKIGGATMPALWLELERLLGEYRNAFYEEAFQRLIDRGVTFAAVAVPPASWVEIDDATDMETARARFGRA